MPISRMYLGCCMWRAPVRCMSSLNNRVAGRIRPLNPQERSRLCPCHAEVEPIRMVYGIHHRQGEQGNLPADMPETPTQLAGRRTYFLPPLDRSEFIGQS